MPPLMQRLRALHLNLPRYDSATVAETLSKALEGLLTLPPTALEEHQRLDQILHETAERVEHTTAERADALSDALDAALKADREEAEAESERPGGSHSPDSVVGQLEHGKTRDGACSLDGAVGKGARTMIRIIAAPSRTVDGVDRPHPTSWDTETEDGEPILAKTHQPFVPTARELIKQGAVPTRPAPCVTRVRCTTASRQERNADHGGRS